MFSVPIEISPFSSVSWQTTDLGPAVIRFLTVNVNTVRSFIEFSIISHTLTLYNQSTKEKDDQ